MCLYDRLLENILGSNADWYFNASLLFIILIILINKWKIIVKYGNILNVGGNYN